MKKEKQITTNSEQVKRENRALNLIDIPKPIILTQIPTIYNGIEFYDQTILIQ